MDSETKKKRRMERLKQEARHAGNPFHGGTMKERMEKQKAYSAAMRKQKDDKLWEQAYPDEEERKRRRGY